MVFLTSGGISSNIYAQSAAIKTNLLHWAVPVTPNLGLEFALGKKTSLEITGGTNFWRVLENRVAKHWIVQPELRFWTCEAMAKHFFGIHAHGAQYNVGGWDIPVGRLTVFKDFRYQGYLYGGGLSYGYQWVLGPRWNLEMTVGGGYARIHYHKFDNEPCGVKLEEGVYNYWGITKAAISFIYVIK